MQGTKNCAHHGGSLGSLGKRHAPCPTGQAEASLAIEAARKPAGREQAAEAACRATADTSATATAAMAAMAATAAAARTAAVARVAAVTTSSKMNTNAIMAATDEAWAVEAAEAAGVTGAATFPVVKHPDVPAPGP